MTDNGSEWQPPQPTPAPWSPGRSVVPASGPVGFRFNSGVAGLVAVLLIVVGAGGYVVLHRSPHHAAASLAPVVVTPVVPAVASPPPASPSPPNDAKISATGWDDTVVHPVTAPVVVGNRVVVYTADAGQLTIRAFDPITGATAWVLPASPSAETAGQPFEVAHTADTVFYFSRGRIRAPNSCRSPRLTLRPASRSGPRSIRTSSPACLRSAQTRPPCA